MSVLNKSVAGGDNVTIAPEELSGKDSVNLTGLITASIIVTLPDTGKDSWRVLNNTTGEYSLQARSGAQGTQYIPRGRSVNVKTSELKESLVPVSPIYDNEKGQPNGVAGLDGDGLVPVDNIPGGVGDGVFSEIASQAEAEAGTENTKGMTALRTAQAIAALGGGGGGSGATIEDEFTFGETIAANQPVYLELTGAAGTAGRIYKMDGGNARTSTSAWFLGFTIDSGTAGSTGTVRLAGKVTGLSSLTAGAVYYAASGGGFTTTAPSFARIVAIAESATVLLINSRGVNDAVLPTQTAIAGAKGYTMGGNSGATAVTDKTVYSTDTTAAQTSANLTANRGHNAGVTNAVDKGYSIAGYEASPTAKADRVTFITDTTAAVTSANATAASYNPTGVSERVTKGYVCGGVSSIGNKLTFSTETTTTQSSVSIGTSQAGGMFGGDTKAYIIGSDGPGNTGRVLTFSTDVVANVTSANFVTSRSWPAGISDGTTKGFWLAGAGGSTTAEKTVFSTDTTSAATSANPSVGGSFPFGISQGATKGYTLGASGATANKTVYATEVTAAQTSANLSSTRTHGASVSDVL